MPGPTSHLVSFIVPTCNRRRFVVEAISYFLAKDCESRELILVAQGAMPTNHSLERIAERHLVFRRFVDNT
ncbi:MAG TPA: hypothetical protein VGX27_14070 [Candidatus Dormibacteraeota bacterium]|nr:hypothetical protein [Candidatus Dormibacteraeota bacterium]